MTHTNQITLAPDSRLQLAPARTDTESVRSSGDALLGVLARRWGTFVLSVLVCLIAAAAYILAATRIYNSSAEVYVEQAGPKVYSDYPGGVNRSDEFLYTQAEVIRSTTVLSRALHDPLLADLKTFARISGDRVEWLKRGNGFSVDVNKKGDVLTISMESPYPQEASLIANAVVKSYIDEQTEQKRGTGQQMIQILKKERTDLEAQHSQILARMLQLKQQNSVLSFRDEKANTALTRLETLSESLNAAQMSAIDLRSQLESVKGVLGNPQAIAAYVESQQVKDREGADREYEELRSQLSQVILALASNSTVVGANNPRLQSLRADEAMLRQRIAAKEKSIVEAHVQDLTVQLAAAEAKQRQLQTSFDAQQREALALDPKAVEYARLEGDADHIVKQTDQLDARIAEIAANSTSAGALNVQVVDWARPALKPAKPQKSLFLATALLAGLLLGTGLCLVREWRDMRLRGIDEVTAHLGIPLIGVIPHLDESLSLIERGRLVHRQPRSPAAEAYRALRTAVELGPQTEARTIAVVSPLPGEGKSTVASNLAIAMAQSGHRTLLIDCDLRQPVQHNIFQVDESVGLRDLLSGQEHVRAAISATAIHGLFVLPCGPIPPNPSELLSGKRFDEVMEALSASFDRIVIDTSPLAAVSDGRIVASWAQATLMVLRLNHSNRQLSNMALEGLRRVGANVIGAVANDVSLSGFYGQYYGASRYLSGEPIAPKLQDLSRSPAPESRRSRSPRGADQPDWALEH